MLKFDKNNEDRVIITSTLRRIMMDLSNESNFSGENETDVDSLPSIQRPYIF